MSETIWKYGLEIVDEQIIEAPESSIPLSVGLDAHRKGSPVARFIGNPVESLVRRFI